MELGLNEFLSQLGKNTVSRIDRETKSREIPGVKQVKEEKKVEMPKRQEKNFEPITEPESKTIEESQLDEDFIESALDYASVIVKTVRQSFDTRAERRKVMESIRSAIDVYLDEYNPNKKNSFFSHNQPKMSESEFNSIPTTTKSQIPGTVPMNDLTGQTINIKQDKPQGIMDNKLNIGVIQGSDGKKHADLSKLNENDIRSLRVLSGIEEIQ
jgi:hypothetical protein